MTDLLLSISHAIDVCRFWRVAKRAERAERERLRRDPNGIFRRSRSPFVELAFA